MKECTYCGGPLIGIRNKCRFCGREYEDNEKKFISFNLPQTAHYKEDSSVGDAIKTASSATVHLSGICTIKTEDDDYIQGETSATGFFVEENGKRYIVTVAHFANKVINDGGMIYAKFPKDVLDTDDAFTVYPLVVDSMNDVALLGMDLPAPEKAEALHLESRSAVEQGDPVITVGCPGNINFIHNRGTVALVSLSDNPFSISKILCDLNTAHGNSGGAILRMSDYAVIGMVQGAFERTPNHTVCIASDAIKQLIYAYERKAD